MKKKTKRKTKALNQLPRQQQLLQYSHLPLLHHLCRCFHPKAYLNQVEVALEVEVEPEEVALEEEEVVVGQHQHQ